MKIKAFIGRDADIHLYSYKYLVCKEDVSI